MLCTSISLYSLVWILSNVREPVHCTKRAFVTFAKQRVFTSIIVRKRRFFTHHLQRCYNYCSRYWSSERYN